MPVGSVHFPGAMAIQEMAPLAEWELHWRSGGHHGRVRMWAPTARSATRVVLADPGRFGIPHETVIVDRCRRVRPIDPAGVKRAA